MTEKITEQNEFLCLEDLLQVNANDRQKGKAEIELVNGKTVCIPIQAVTADEEAAIRKRATRSIPTKRGRVQETNDLLYNSLLIAKATDQSRTNLNWQSKELAEKVNAKVPAPEFIIPKFISIGGIIELVDKITSLSGLKDDFDDQVDAVKN